jgi:pullulanase
MKITAKLIIMILFLDSCTIEEKRYLSFEDYPIATNTNLWLDYSKLATEFKLWSPTAEQVTLKLYRSGDDTKSYSNFEMETGENGLWKIKIDGDLDGTYYTYQVKADGHWLNETPGIYAKAVGVNGKKAMVLDMESTNPEHWERDKGPQIKSANEAIIYELHVRDMTIHPQSGSSMPGKYLGLIESNTKGPENVATGIDHLKELGITHVHLLPSFDHYAIDETKLDSVQYNWGYDPQNYNVPEGSYSSDPYTAEVRIKEFKKMVQTFHTNGIGVILDVAYNHTGKTEESNFNQEVPGYYYRHWEDGTYADGAACGNETASERAMMRKFILESVSYWAKEYHVDGFRFDLMGIHDTQTMNQVSARLKEINPNILLYGEGWTAKDSPLPKNKRALKKHAQQIPKIAVFSDDLRDGIKGSVFDNDSKGFVSGAKNMEESIKFGVVGSILHPQIDYDEVNYSDQPWSSAPWQAISYVSCHDNHTLFDKLKVSRRDASQEALVAMDKLANAIVLTSQGTAFIHAGAEVLRTKKEEENSYNLPDSINQIDWNWKLEHKMVFDYYKNLIELRKSHPAFRMTNSKDVVDNLTFLKSTGGVVSYVIQNNANDDSWNTILVIYNANPKPIKHKLKGTWQLAVIGDDFSLVNGKPIKKTVQVPPISMLVAYQK